MQHPHHVFTLYQMSFVCIHIWSTYYVDVYVPFLVNALKLCCLLTCLCHCVVINVIFLTVCAWLLAAWLFAVFICKV